MQATHLRVACLQKSPYTGGNCESSTEYYSERRCPCSVALGTDDMMKDFFSIFAILALTATERINAILDEDGVRSTAMVRIADLMHSTTAACSTATYNYMHTSV